MQLAVAFMKKEKEKEKECKLQHVLFVLFCFVLFWTNGGSIKSVRETSNLIIKRKKGKENVQVACMGRHWTSCVGLIRVSREREREREYRNELKCKWEKKGPQGEWGKQSATCMRQLRCNLLESREQEREEKKQKRIAREGEGRGGGRV